MKVIFLDIDGVLNCTKTPNPRKFPYIVDRRLLRRYEPAVLFSARHWGIRFIDVIPDMPGKPRRNEILAWLNHHPRVERFAVIDDEDDELDELPLFQPSAAIGLTAEIAKGVAAYLDGKTDRDMRSGPLVRAIQNVHSIFKHHAG